MVRLSGADYEKKKTAVSAVIDFNDTYGVDYNKMEVYKHFGMDPSSWYKCLATAPLSSYLPPRPRKPTSDSKLLILKKERSEDSNEEESLISSTAQRSTIQQPTTPERRNPVRNNGQGRKKLKMLIEAETSENEDSSPSTPLLSNPSPTYSDSSPPTPQQLLTPPNRKIAQPRKRIGSQSGRQREPVIKFEHEVGDYEDEV